MTKKREHPVIKTTIRIEPLLYRQVQKKLIDLGVTMNDCVRIYFEKLVRHGDKGSSGEKEG